MIKITAIYLGFDIVKYSAKHFTRITSFYMGIIVSVVHMRPGGHGIILISM